MTKVGMTPFADVTIKRRMANWIQLLHSVTLSIRDYAPTFIGLHIKIGDLGEPVYPPLGIL